MRGASGDEVVAANSRNQTLGGQPWDSPDAENGVPRGVSLIRCPNVASGRSSYLHRTAPLHWPLALSAASRLSSLGHRTQSSSHCMFHHIVRLEQGQRLTGKPSHAVLTTKIVPGRLTTVSEVCASTSCSKPAAGAGGVDVVEDKCLGLDLNSKVCLV